MREFGGLGRQVVLPARHRAHGLGWQPHAERSAHALLALDLDGTPGVLDELLDGIEPHVRAFDVQVQALKKLKKPGLLRLTQPQPIVLHAQFGPLSILGPLLDAFAGIVSSAQGHFFWAFLATLYWINVPLLILAGQVIR